MLHRAAGYQPGVVARSAGCVVQAGHSYIDNIKRRTLLCLQLARTGALSRGCVDAVTMLCKELYSDISHAKVWTVLVSSKLT